jgi:hypothetical protein
MGKAAFLLKHAPSLEHKLHLLRAVSQIGVVAAQCESSVHGTQVFTAEHPGVGLEQSSLPLHCTHMPSVIEPAVIEHHGSAVPFFMHAAFEGHLTHLLLAVSQIGVAPEQFASLVH